MNKRRIKFTKIDIRLFAAFLILIKPAYINNISIVNHAWIMGQLILMIYAIYVWIKVKKTAIVNCVVIIYLLFVISSLVNRVSLITCLQKVAPYLSLAILCNHWFQKYKEKSLIPLHHLLALYTYINFATILLFPNGLYQSITSDGISYVSCWFLGYKNPQIRTLLIGLFLEYLLYYSPEEKRKLRFRSIVLSFVVVFSTLYVKSITAIISLALFIVLLVLLKKNNRILLRILSPVGIILLFLGANLILLFMQSTALPLFSSLFGRFITSDLGTASSRTYVWQSALIIIRDNILLGNGGNGFTANIFHFNVTHPHNFVLYQWLSGGIFAVLISFVLIYRVFKACFRQKEQYICRLFISLYISVLLMGVVESLTEFPLLYAIFVIGYSYARSFDS